MPSATKVQTGYLEAVNPFELSPGTASLPTLTFTNSSATGMFSPSIGSLAFSTSSVQNALTILSGGNVGIGITNPSRILDVRASSSQNPAYILKNTGSTNTGANSTISVSSETTTTMSSGYGPAIAFEHRDTTGGYAGCLISSLANADPFGADLVLSSRYYEYVEGLRIKSNGNVGIGTTNPGKKLDVSGNIRGQRFEGINSLVLNNYTTVNPASNVFLYSQPNDRDSWIYLDSADTGSNWGIYHRQIDSTVGDLPANSIGFVGGGTNTLQSYISLANGNAYFKGNLGIGIANPSTKLQVVGDVTASMLYLSGGAAGNIGNRLVVGNNTVNFSLQDTNLRPTIQAHGQYPVVSLNHTVTNNTNHGPTLQFTCNGVGNQFVVGTNGSGTFLSMGYSSANDWNPHNGIAGYNGTSFFHANTSGYIGLGAQGDWSESGGPGSNVPGYNLHFIGSNNAANGHAAYFDNRVNGANNGSGFIFRNLYGNHSWGIVSEYRVEGGGTDRPSILFSTGYNSNTWSVGFGYTDDNFRIKYDHGHRNGDWGTTALMITKTSTYIAGNLGIGIANPGYTLDVDGSIKTRATGAGSGLLLHTNTGWSIAGNLAQFWTGQTNGFAFYSNSSGDATNERVRITSSGSVGIGTTNPSYKLHVVGSFAATTKSFVIDHPTKEGKKLRHGSLEGPENGVYVRGRLKGSNTIELPDYWVGLVHEDSITANLTPIGDSATPRVRKIANNQIEVFSKEEGEIDCFYTVFAERKDVEKLEVEI